MTGDISHYSTLRDEQRIEARHQARANLLAKLGGEPQFEVFERREHSRYGPKTDLWVMRIMAVFLVAAFLVSAFHIYHVGRTTYQEGIDNWWQAALTGLALVALSESAVLVLSVIPAMWDMPRSVQLLMYSGAISAAFIAAIGNIDVTITYSQQPFDWAQEWALSLSRKPARFIMATMPPLLTLIVGQGLKYRLLAKMEERFEARAKYEHALAAWQETATHVEAHPLWPQTYANALWDAWCYRKRRDMVAEITLEEKRAIVAREMEAEWWFSGAIAPESLRNAGKGPDDHLEPRERVKVYLEEHKGDVAMSQKDLATFLDVSPATVSRAMTDYNRNGHGA